MTGLYIRRGHRGSPSGVGVRSPVRAGRPHAWLVAVVAVAVVAVVAIGAVAVVAVVAIGAGIGVAVLCGPPVAVAVAVAAVALAVVLVLDLLGLPRLLLAVLALLVVLALGRRVDRVVVGAGRVGLAGALVLFQVLAVARTRARVAEQEELQAVQPDLGAAGDPADHDQRGQHGHGLAHGADLAALGGRARVGAGRRS